MLFHGTKKKFRKLKQVMRPKNQIYKRIALFDLLHDGWFLHHTAAKPDKHVRIFLLHAV